MFVFLPKGILCIAGFSHSEKTTSILFGVTNQKKVGLQIPKSHNDTTKKEIFQIKPID